MATNSSAVTALGRRSTTGRAAMFQDLRAAFGRWQERSRIRFELAQMNHRELADLGLNPSDIDDVANGTTAAAINMVREGRAPLAVRS